MLHKYTSRAGCVAAAVILGISAEAANEWNSPTPPALPTQVLPLLNVEVNRDTDAITFVNTNNDPFVYTRVYVLKHADPYEIRPYVMAAIRSRRIDTNETKVEAIRYMDGTGMLIVSAEQYRFDSVGDGMTLDQLIASLDCPNMAAEAGRTFFLYYPKYFDAPTLATLIRRVGMTHAGDWVELQGGIDTVRSDTGLNALLFYTSPFSKKSIEDVLAQYDAPTTEAVVEYTIYELDDEDDGILGADFQAWKNGPGADLFAAGARYANGWDFAANNVASNLTESSRASVINFNPKWNTKYLDFLVAKSKGKVITSGSLSIMNRATGSIRSLTRMPVIENGEETAGGGQEVKVNEAMVISAWGPDYALSAIDQDNGLPLSIVPAGYSGELVVTRTLINTKVYYTLSLDHSGASFVRSDGKNYGRIAKAYDVVVTQTDTSVFPAQTIVLDDYSSATAYRIAKDKTRVTTQAEFGFQLDLTPEVNTEATILKLDMSNTNLLGFQSDGKPRTSESRLATSLMLGNDGGVFYVGGLEKSAWVRSVNKVPYLGDIPGLGWAFSSESESVKKTHLIAVLKVRPVNPDSPVPQNLKEEATKIDETSKSGEIDKKYYQEDKYGFDQYLLDPNKD